MKIIIFLLPLYKSQISELKMKQLEIADTYSLNDLRIVERAKPAAPGPGQVMVKMGAVSLNFRDLLVATGNGHWKPAPGRIPASDDR
jgi:NADPH:quinone reductase-like Zn-dependent oxidoreductase